MADNVAITAGAGTSVATDDVGGVHYQRVKPAFGADGSATDVSASNPLPVLPTQTVGAYQANTTVLSTELDACPNSSNTLASTAFDNTSTRYPLADLVVFVAAQGSARSAGAAVAVYMTTRGDGTNFDSTNEITAELVAVVPLDAATTARRRTVRGITLPPEQFKLFVRNATGQALAASGSTVVLRPYYTAG